MNNGVMRAIAEYGYSRYALKQALESSFTARRSFALMCRMRASRCRRRGDWYSTSKHVSTAVRLLEAHGTSELLRNAHSQILAAAGISAEGCGYLHTNQVLSTFLRSPEASAAAQLYAR